MRVGFTGTQTGCTDAQREALRRVLSIYRVEEMHHGDCIGADADAHALAREAGVCVVLHPPTIDAKRAFCAMLAGETVHDARPYLDRNHRIVDATEWLVACPKEETGWALRSGTWATVRYARKRGRVVVIVRPSGQLNRWEQGRVTQ